MCLCRCFEVLGFDIMIDSHLNPWLIEVNHLPSFGTDTALDLDIKERLMEQVFAVLPAMPDDQQVYQAHQRAESEKRLIAQRRTQQQLREKQEAEQQRERELAKHRAAAARARREAALNAMRADAAANTPQEGSPSNFHGDGEAPRGDHPYGENAVEGNEEGEEFDEECTPERIEEIKEILREVYSKYSPEKVPKIDRLLTKYASHEEEFLRFVFNKYGVSPELYRKASKSSVTESLSEKEEHGSGKSTSSETGDAETAVQPADCNQSEIDSGATEDAMQEPHTAPTTPKADQLHRAAKQRVARSMSPPRSKTSLSSTASSGGSSNSTARRPTAAWKGAPEEDAQFRLVLMGIIFIPFS